MAFSPSYQGCGVVMATHLFRFGSFNTNDGLETRFRKDKWLENITLREQYLVLYNIFRHKSDIIAVVLEISIAKYDAQTLFSRNQTCGMEE